MLEEMGFLASEAGKPRAPPRGKATRKRHSTAQVLWQQPHCLGLLRLDRAALKIVADRSAPGKKASVPAGAQDLSHLCTAHFALWHLFGTLT